MLKKIITLGLVVLLTLAFTAPAFAQEGDEVGGETTEEPGEDSTIPENPHPIVLAIAQRYNVTYAEVAAMFNGTMGDYENTSEEDSVPNDGDVSDDDTRAKGHGLGEIMLAYQTALRLDDGTTAADLLAEKDEVGGWGNVWRAHEMTGKDRVKPEKSNNGKNEEKIDNGNHGDNNKNK